MTALRVFTTKSIVIHIVLNNCLMADYLISFSYFLPLGGIYNCPALSIQIRTIPSKDKLHTTFIQFLSLGRLRVTMSTSTVAYIPSSLSSKLDDYKIVQIKAAAHEPGPIQDTTVQTNHWTFYLVTSPKTSIRLDMTPANVSGVGCLIVSELEYVVSKSAVKVCDLSNVESYSLETIIELLQRERYDCYKFNERGTGCRNWVDSVLMLLSRKQITTENETEHARAALRQAWGPKATLLPAAIQSGIDHGTFYGTIAAPAPTKTVRQSKTCTSPAVPNTELEKM
jgi:hypothetical protein